MKFSIKLLSSAVIAVVLLLVTQNSLLADEKNGKYVFFKDKEGSFYKSYSQSKNNNKVEFKTTDPKPIFPFNVDGRPTFRSKVYPIASHQNNNYIQVYLSKLRKALSVYKY